MYSYNFLYKILATAIFSISAFSSIAAHDTDFKEILVKEKGIVNIHWHESSPFIYADEQNNLAGIEFEIINGFKDYLYSRHGVDIRLNWIREASFYDVLNNVKGATESNHFGVSAFSITDDRDEILDFTNSYFPDVSVLISYGSNLKLSTVEDFKLMADSLTAVTIRGTTYERMLINLQDQLNIALTINYVPSYANIVENILKKEGQYGFIDLPIYLLYLEDGAKIQRHDLFSTVGDGFAFIIPTGSDWKTPFDEYLADPITSINLRQILMKYLGDNIYSFMNDLQSTQKKQEIILAKEKELVQKSLSDLTSILEREKKIRFYLIVTVTFIIVLLLLLLFLFFYVSKKNKRLELSEATLIKERDKRVMNNKRLMNRNVQLNAMSEERNTLFHMVVHDLRTPINNIKGLIELLQNEPDSSSSIDKKTLLKKVHDSCKRMNLLIDQIFASEKGGIQKMNSLNEELDLIELFKTTVDNFINSANKKNIALLVTTTTDKCTIHSDYLQLTQIFENLISNAIKFSPKSSEVICSIECSKTHATVKIQDNGPGFNDEDKLNLFKIFQPLTARPTDGEKSTGLGLAIVKRCCDALGADLVLDDDYKDGACFRVSIPKKVTTRH